MRLFSLQLEAVFLQLSFFAYNCVLEILPYNSSFFYLELELFDLQLSFFAYSGKVRLISTSLGCKQRSSTVSKKTPTVN